MTLPKGFDPPPRPPKDDDDKEDKFSIRLCVGLMILALILIVIGALLVLPVIFFGANPEVFVDDSEDDFLTLRIIFVVSWIIGIPMMILAYLKHRTLELTTPSELTKMFHEGGAERQCTICQKHPTSKNYHIKNVHKMKNVNVNDYFTMCGCGKCSKYL